MPASSDYLPKWVPEYLHKASGLQATDSTRADGAPTADLLSYIFADYNRDLTDHDKPVLIDASNPLRFVTPHSGRSTVRKLIAGLRAAGIESGDCVCVHSFNDIHYPLLHLAIIGAGGVFTGSNPGYTSLELNHHIETSNAKYIIGEPTFLSTILETAQKYRISTSRIFILDTFDKAPYDGLKSWEVLLQHGEEDWNEFKDAQKQRTTIASHSFTSGSTGLPKSAMIAHNYIVSQSCAVESKDKSYEVSRLLCLPFFHAFVGPLVIGCALRERHPVYVMRRFEISQFLQSIERYGITETAMVPAMIVALLKSPLTRKEKLRSLRYVWTAGSPLRLSTQKEFQSLLSPEAKMSQAWGMTEIGWVTAFFWPQGDDTGSVGKPLPGYQIKIVDDEGSIILEDGGLGELFVKTPYMMLGYLNNPQATASIIDPEGWLKTGDIGYCKDGKYYIADRKKDLIKVRGWQVAPAEVEAVLLQHPQVLGAVVLGVPDADGTGELCRAYIVHKHGENEPDPQSEVLSEDIKAFVAARLARYKHLDGGVIFVDEIPRNAAGKTLRAKLRAL